MRVLLTREDSEFIGRVIPGNLRKVNANSGPQKVIQPPKEVIQRLETIMEPHNERLSK